MPNTNYERPIITWGNSFYIEISLKKYDEGQYSDFDLTKATDLKVYLVCAIHNTEIPLEYEILDGYNYILKCFVDYRLLHTTSYGVVVEGFDEHNIHFRWCMLPKEGFLVINNTSGQKITDEVQTLGFDGKVGWGITTETDLTNYYTKNETNALLDEKADVNSLAQVATTGDYNDLSNKPTIPAAQVQSDWNQTNSSEVDYIKNKPDLSIYATESELSNYYDKGETDGLLNNKVDTITLISDYYNKNTVNNLLDTKADNSDLNNYYNKTETNTLLNQKANTSDLNNKQDTLVSGINIKTINNQSLLGSGNINIQGGGGTQVQANWTETDNTDPSYIQNKPDLTVYAYSYNLATVATTGNYNDLSNKPDLSVYATQSDLNNKQDTLVSGTNIKTINNQSLLGSGNIDIQGGEKPYEEQYLTFKAITAGKFTFTRNVDYSLDNGLTWTTLTLGTASPTVSAGDKILWKGTLTQGNFGIGKFSSTGNFNVCGNIMSLLFGNNFINQTSLSGYNYAFRTLFESCTHLISAEYLILPATTLAEGCYFDMFHNCPSLTTAPELHATTLVDYCYYGMFYGCTALTTAPELLATTLANYCYQYMFYGCTSLNYIKCLATDISANRCTYNWVKNMSASGTFIKADSMSSWTIGNHGIPSGWNDYNVSKDVDAKLYDLATVATTGNYNDLSNKPDLSVYAEKNDLDILSMSSIKQFQCLEDLEVDISNLQNNVEKQLSDLSGDLYNKINSVEFDTDESNKVTTLSLNDLNTNKQDTLVSGTNIKTINNQSLLGSGNIDIQAGGSQVQANWTESNSSSYAYILNKPDLTVYAYSYDLATVATTGNYNDLSNKPTIPDTTGMVTSSTNGLKIEVVAALPASPDSNTIYIIQ